MEGGAITQKDWEHNSKADELATEVLEGMEIYPGWEDLDLRRKAAQDRLKEAVAVLRSARRQKIDLAGDWEQGRRHRRAQGGPTSRAPNRGMDRMRPGDINGHHFEWEGSRLVCTNCRRGADAPKYWLDVTKAACRGHKAMGTEAHRNRLAKIMGLERLEGQGRWEDPFTHHLVEWNGPS